MVMMHAVTQVCGVWALCVGESDEGSLTNRTACFNGSVCTEEGEQQHRVQRRDDKYLYFG